MLRSSASVTSRSRISPFDGQSLTQAFVPTDRQLSRLSRLKDDAELITQITRPWLIYTRLPLGSHFYWDRWEHRFFLTLLKLLEQLAITLVMSVKSIYALSNEFQCAEDYIYIPSLTLL